MRARVAGRRREASPSEAVLIRQPVGENHGPGWRAPPRRSPDNAGTSLVKAAQAPYPHMTLVAVAARRRASWFTARPYPSGTAWTAASRQPARRLDPMALIRAVLRHGSCADGAYAGPKLGKALEKIWPAHRQVAPLLQRAVEAERRRDGLQGHCRLRQLFVVERTLCLASVATAVLKPKTSEATMNARRSRGLVLHLIVRQHPTRSHEGSQGFEHQTIHSRPGSKAITEGVASINKLR